jgi:hypothetical protein
MLKIRICLFIAVLSVLGASCSKRWCNTHYPQIAETITNETVRDSIVYKDTTFYITLPGEKVIDSVSIPCPPPSPSYVPKRVTAETPLARASAWWQYPVIKLELIQKDTTIEKRLSGAIREAYHWKTLYEKLQIKPEPVKFVPKIYKFYGWVFWLLIAGGIGYVVVKFKLWKLIKLFK